MTHVSEDTKCRLKAMADEGRPWPEIYDVLRSRHHARPLWEALIEMGYNPPEPRRNRLWTADDQRMMEEMIDRGETVHKIALAMKRNHKHIKEKAAIYRKGAAEPKEPKIVLPFRKCLHCGGMFRPEHRGMFMHPSCTDKEIFRGVAGHSNAGVRTNDRL
jgi:hypothetical protein